MPESLITSLITRLKAEVSDLRTVEGAASLSVLVKNGSLPQQTPAAWVIPVGMIGGQGQSAAGLYTQMMTEVLGVIVAFNTHSATAAGKMGALDALIRAVIDAVAGWGPDEAVGVFEMRRGNLLSMNAGAVIYQIDFAINDQLRIAR
ncbi:MAG: hypothetical protein GW948_02195 [Rhodobacterales bacterium]|nr:hypothetical protein [Rhodobacterales bacterium]